MAVSDIERIKRVKASSQFPWWGVSSGCGCGVKLRELFHQWTTTQDNRVEMVVVPRVGLVLLCLP